MPGQETRHAKWRCSTKSAQLIKKVLAEMKKAGQVRLINRGRGTRREHVRQRRVIWARLAGGSGIGPVPSARPAALDGGPQGTAVIRPS